MWVWVNGVSCLFISPNVGMLQYWDQGRIQLCRKRVWRGTPSWQNNIITSWHTTQIHCSIILTSLWLNVWDYPGDWASQRRHCPPGGLPSLCTVHRQWIPWLQRGFDKTFSSSMTSPKHSLRFTKQNSRGKSGQVLTSGGLRATSASQTDPLDPHQDFDWDLTT